MTKICHMTSVHKRYDVRIFQKECITLRKLGYEVHLVVSDAEPDEIVNDIYIHSTGYLPKNRFERMTGAAKEVYKLAKSLNAEIYHFHDPELMGFGVKLSKQGKKVIFDSHEHTIVQIYSKRYLIFPKAVSKLFELYQKRVIRQIAEIITPTPQLVDLFKTINENAFLVTNYPKLEESMAGIKKKRQICFTGGCDSQWMLENIAIAVSELDCEIIIAGSGNEEYINAIIKKGRGKVKYVGQLGKEDVYRLQSESLAGMAVNYGIQTIKEGGTLGNTKMFEYMMNGSPIICTDFPLWKMVVEKDDCGICVDANSVEEIRKAIKYFLDCPDESIRMGENARAAVEREYNWDTQVENLAQAYRTLITE